MIILRIAFFTILIIVVSVLVSSTAASIFLDVSIMDVWKALISVFLNKGI